MTRYTFDPRPDWKPRKSQRDMQISIVDTTLDLIPRRAAKIIGPVEHAEAIRAAAKAYCDTLNGKVDRIKDLASRVAKAARTPPKGWEGDGQPGFWHSAALDAAIEELVTEVEP